MVSVSKLFPLSKPPLSPPFHPHSLLSVVARCNWVSLHSVRCAYLVIDLCSPLRREPGRT